MVKGRGLIYLKSSNPEWNWWMRQVWVKKRARTLEITQEIQHEAKEETKTVRPDVRAYYPIYSDTPGAWQADLMFIPYTNLKQETRLHTFCV